MTPLSANDVESELSYAYLHAVSSRAKVWCQICGRLPDNNGVDAQLTSWGPFGDDVYRKEVDLKVQLKATIASPTINQAKISYNLAGINRFDDLRETSLSVPRILVVLFLPKEQDFWLQQSENSLILQKCAYWVSLRGAKASTNLTSQTIYIPQDQRFDVNGLQSLMSRIAQNDIPCYEDIEQ